MTDKKVEPLRKAGYDEQGNKIGQDIVLRPEGKLAPPNKAKYEGQPRKTSPNTQRARIEIK